jgi:hypothetical protein
MPAGRPTEYRIEFRDTVIALGREGKSKAQIAAALDVSSAEHRVPANESFPSSVTLKQQSPPPRIMARSYA